jgi:hypothetical protein
LCKPREAYGSTGRLRQPGAMTNRPPPAASLTHPPRISRRMLQGARITSGKNPHRCVQVTVLKTPRIEHSELGSYLDSASTGQRPGCYDIEEVVLNCIWQVRVGCLLSGARVAASEQCEDRQMEARTRVTLLAERSQMAERQASETILTQTVPTLVFLRRSSC